MVLLCRTGLCVCQLGDSKPDYHGNHMHAVVELLLLLLLFGLSPK